MSSWDDAKKKNEEAKAAGGQFLRLQDHGDKFVGAFLGDPHTLDFVWDEKAGRYSPWTKEAEAAGAKKTTRYSLNVFVLKMGQGKELKPVPAAEALKVWECNNQTFTDVLKVRDKYGLDVWLFEVERNGKKGNSKTTYSVLPDTKIDADLKKILDAQKLHDLTKVKDDDEETDMGSHEKGKANGAANGATAAATPAPAAAAAPAPQPSPNDPIDADTAGKLIGRLKPLPKEKIESFLKEFDIKRVKDLPRNKLSAAEAFVATLEGSAAPDPFA